jgi:hypothetical protein
MRDGARSNSMCLLLSREGYRHPKRSDDKLPGDP